MRLALLALAILVAGCTTPGVRFVCHPVPVDLHGDHTPGHRPGD